MTDIVNRLREHNEPPFDYIAHEAADIIEKLREVLQQQSDAVSRAYANGYDSAYAMGYSEGLKETLYDGMPRLDDRGDNLDGN